MRFVFGSLVLGLLISGLNNGIMRSQAAPPPSVAGHLAPPKVSCGIDRNPPSDADLALSREDYGAATDLFTRRVTTDPVASKLGLIRVLIEQNQFLQAEAKAQAWIDSADAAENDPKQPDSPLDQAAAAEAMGEALYRAGELPRAFEQAGKALKLDPCYAQSYLLAARVERLTSDDALAVKRIQVAHTLKPNDLQIHRAWMGTLSRRQRLAEQSALLKDGKALNDKDKAQLEEALAHAGDYARNDCRLVTPVDAAKFKIVPILDGPNRREGLALDVSFNGKQRRLEIDTGASGILLTHGAASGLGLVEGQKLEAGGVGDQGRVASAIAHVASVKIGGLEFENCPVEYLAKRGKLEIDGLIGANVFSHWIVTLDYPDLEMRIDPLPKRPETTVAAVATNGTTDKNSQDPEDRPPVVHNRSIAPEMKDWQPVFRYRHEILLPVSLNGSKEKLFLVDTGAGLMSISPAAAREVTKVSGDSSMHVYGISGEVEKVLATEDFTLTFAHLRQMVRSMTAFDTTMISHDAGIEISGFLGAPILNRLTVHIDYRDNLIKFDYDPRKDPVH
jgi:predicted aspartyl protease